MLRHTKPQVKSGTCYGQTDLDVADSFEQEAAQVLTNLPDIAAIVSSPLKRCRLLADRIAAHTGLAIRLDPRFTELNFGRWENLAWDMVPRAELDQWASDFHDARPHGGESVGDLKARVDTALSDIRAAQTPTVIVTHAGVIRAALAQGRDAHHFQTQIDFGEIIRLPDIAKERA